MQSSAWHGACTAAALALVRQTLPLRNGTDTARAPLTCSERSGGGASGSMHELAGLGFASTEAKRHRKARESRARSPGEQRHPAAGTGSQERMHGIQQLRST